MLIDDSSIELSTTELFISSDCGSEACEAPAVFEAVAEAVAEDWVDEIVEIVLRSRGSRQIYRILNLLQGKLIVQHLHVIFDRMKAVVHE